MTKKIRDPQAPTSVSTRVWCTTDFDAIQELLTSGGADKLPPDLLVLAQKAGATAGAWPNWLTLGIGMKFFRRWLEEQLAPQTTTVILPPAPVESERVLALRSELDSVPPPTKRRTAEIIEQLRELGVSR